MKRPEKHLAVIPARAGSKGLIGKNMRYLDGYPLLTYTLDAAIDAAFFDRIVITTDMEDMIDYVGGYADDKVMTLRRPKRLCGDKVPLAPVIVHALQETEAAYMENYTDIWTLQVTSPLRTDEDIIKAHRVYKESGADSLTSVTEEHHAIFKKERGFTKRVHKPGKTRQTTEPYYVGNGAIFITKKGVLLGYKDRLGITPALYVMDKVSSIDIHTQEDLELAEYYLNRRHEE